MNYNTKDYYFASYNNVIDMCKDRGYTTKNNVDIESFKLDEKEFEEKYKEHESNHRVFNIPFGQLFDENNVPVYITMVESNRDQKNFVKIILQSIYEDTKNTVSFTKEKDMYRYEILDKIHCIIIHNLDSVKPGGSQFHHNFELFSVKRIFFNVTRHKNVPEHILLGEKERKEIFETKNITFATCPKILSSDPVNLYYNGKPGQVYKIIRNNKGVYFRTIVPGNPSSLFAQLRSQLLKSIKKVK